MTVPREKIINFLNEQIAQANFKAKAYVYNFENELNPQRSIYVRLKSHLNKYMAGKRANRWITLTGLRGSGKTTLLSQLFYDQPETNCYKLFISVDRTSEILGISLDEVISAYEDLIGKSLEELDKPLLLFLDEVQYDTKWGAVLKSVYDRSNMVFIIATGSAALLMNSNTDIARRTIFEKLFPLSFTEYLKIKKNKYETKGLGREVRETIFESKDAAAVYAGLRSLEKKANSYYYGVTRLEFDKYINYGSLPFMLAADNEAIVYDQINKTMDRVINGDIRNMGRFKSEIISKIPAILYAIADMDAFNLTTISNAFEISRPTVAEIFDLLEYTEVVHRILPYGSHLNQVRKPSKYLFSAPAFRAMYYKIIGSSMSQEAAKGKLHEDLVGMYLHRFGHKKPGSFLAYDSSAGGADFIFGFGRRQIIIEVGAGKKHFGQVVNTAKKVKADYGLIISSSPLELSSSANIVKIPLRLFLLT